MQNESNKTNNKPKNNHKNENEKNIQQNKQNDHHEDLNTKLKTLEVKILELNNELKQKEDKIQELKEQVKSMNDSYLFKLTEKMNEAKQKIDEKTKELQQRFDNEKNNFEKYAFAKPLTELIGIINDLTAAINTNSDDPKVNNYLKGLKLYLSILNSWLNSVGVHEIEVKLNDEYDSNIMEAIDVDKSGSSDKFVVTKIIAKGYKLHDRLLLPTKVIISNLPKDN